MTEQNKRGRADTLGAILNNSEGASLDLSSVALKLGISSEVLLGALKDEGTGTDEAVPETGDEGMEQASSANTTAPQQRKSKKILTEEHVLARVLVTEYNMESVHTDMYKNRIRVIPNGYINPSTFRDNVKKDAVELKKGYTNVNQIKISKLHFDCVMGILIDTTAELAVFRSHLDALGIADRYKLVPPATNDEALESACQNLCFKAIKDEVLSLTNGDRLDGPWACKTHFPPRRTRQDTKHYSYEMQTHIIGAIRISRKARTCHCTFREKLRVGTHELGGLHMKASLLETWNHPYELSIEIKEKVVAVKMEADSPTREDTSKGSGKGRRNR